MWINFIEECRPCSILKLIRGAYGVNLVHRRTVVRCSRYTPRTCLDIVFDFYHGLITLALHRTESDDRCLLTHDRDENDRDDLQSDTQNKHHECDLDKRESALCGHGR